LSEKMITAITTVSFNEIMRCIDDKAKIIALRVCGGRQSNTQDKSLEIIGGNIRCGSYCQIKINNGKYNSDIDDFWAKKISEKMEEHRIEDMPIQKLTIEFESDTLAEEAISWGFKQINENDTTFIATFIAEKCHGVDADELKKHEINNELIKYHGFQHRVLNLKKLINKSQVLGLPTKNQKNIVEWNGNEINYEISPPVVTRFFKTIFDNYAITKVYSISSENKLILVRVEE